MHKREKESFDSSSGEEICASAPQLPRARAAQDELAAMLFDEEVDLVQKAGKTLNFIDEDLSYLLFRDFLFGFPAEKLGCACIPE
jgi:hypothetical protein